MVNRNNWNAPVPFRLFRSATTNLLALPSFAAAPIRSGPFRPTERQLCVTELRQAVPVIAVEEMAVQIQQAHRNAVAPG